MKDSDPRPSGPKPDALTGLRYISFPPQMRCKDTSVLGILQILGQENFDKMDIFLHLESLLTPCTHVDGGVFYLLINSL